ncbi:MAG TPA: DUF885 domain-containing protein [Thermoanaerobaculia bacterium]|nr:DUF885 domain-containing protein [Thermoanaerobaculia bacterium]
MKRALPLLLVLAFAASALAQSESQKLHALFDEEWEWQLREDPEGATYVGDRRYNERLTDRSADAFERRRVHDRETLQRIEAIDRSKLSDDDRINYDLFLLHSRNAVEGDRYPFELMPMTQQGGVQDLLSELAQAIPRDTVKDHEQFLVRMRAFPRAVDDTIALLRRGLAAGLTPPRTILGKVEGLIANQIADDPTKSPTYELAFTNFRPSIPAAEQQRLQKEAAEVLRASVIPALRKLQAFWRDEYYPKTRQSIAFTDLPNGKEWYAFRVQLMTTTARTPDEIHELGLSEVKRIRGEMERVKEQSGYKGSLEEFFKFLRTDPQFFHTTREDLLRGYRDIAKRIDPELMKLFGRLPRTPYGVIPVPAYAEKTTTTAYYNGGSPEAHRPGYFYANLYDLNARPKWEMESLTLHEAVPGHHLQISIAQELENVPRFRRFAGFTAFVEGWGLYAESLGPELGMYSDPYSKFGQLTYEMWRAVRLVVDTGMHTKGWTRQQAIDFFVSNSSKPLHDIEVEIDRYIGWPAQALAYKMGELKMKELRARATRELGERFDVRAFHDTLLGAGPLPLSILETRIDEWIAAKKQSGAKATVTLRR